MRNKIFFLLFLSAAFVNFHLFSQVDPPPERFSDKIEAFRTWDSKNSLPKDYILFLGSSSIRMWRTAESFPDLAVVNRGFGGAQISDLLFYSHDIALKYPAPRGIVFYCGDNDITAGKSPERVFNDYKKFVSGLNMRFARTPIITISAKPSMARWHLWEKMAALNDLMQTYSDSSSLLFFADISDSMRTPDGHPDSTLFLDDKLHLNEKGYALWNHVLTVLLNQVCGRNE